MHTYVSPCVLTQRQNLRRHGNHLRDIRASSYAVVCKTTFVLYFHTSNKQQTVEGRQCGKGRGRERRHVIQQTSPLPCRRFLLARSALPDPSSRLLPAAQTHTSYKSPNLAPLLYMLPLPHRKIVENELHIFCVSVVGVGLPLSLALCPFKKKIQMDDVDMFTYSLFFH